MGWIASIVTDDIKIDIGAGNIVVLSELEVVGEAAARRWIGIDSSDFSED